MKYRDLQIQTQREAPNNARTEGFAFLVRAGYLTRENALTRLGETAIDQLKHTANKAGQSFFSTIDLSTRKGSYGHVFFLTNEGRARIMRCSECEYLDLATIAYSNNFRFQYGQPLPMEKIHTPDCATIESLSTFLKVKKSQTAKAILLTRLSDRQFIMGIVRGDKQFNPHKLHPRVGETRPASNEEILAVGAAPGYASPIGIKNALVVVDEVIPHTINLAAGANVDGYHFINTNYGRDYSADIVIDITQAEVGDICARCEEAAIGDQQAEILMDQNGEYDFQNILLALAMSHHDDKGLTLPHPAAPFDVYLMHIGGKELDTRAKAEEIYNSLRDAGVSVLFDDRDERAGVKFNDADLIGCPIRVTVGEKGLKEGMVELKSRKEKENQLVKVDEIVEKIKRF
ncbi:MAG: Proline--tRNA ligase [Anaerolineales bacterium]|nr:Proline--tRNA ligase [Anaerolineales bacterium]